MAAAGWGERHTPLDGSKQARCAGWTMDTGQEGFVFAVEMEVVVGVAAQREEGKCTSLRLAS